MYRTQKRTDRGEDRIWTEDEKVEIDGGEDITGRWTESWWGR